MSSADSNKVILENIYLSNMTRQKNQACNSYTISEIVSQDRLKSVLSYLLFAHAFTGCDTTSAIHKFGKNTIFSENLSSKTLRSIADIFSKDHQTPEQIRTATINFFFATLHSPRFLQPEIQKRKYEDMILASCSNIDPSVLPPYLRAAFYHGLRVYHQVQIWLHLMNTDFECRISALGRNSFKSISLSISDSAITFAQKAPRHSLQNMEHFKPAF